MTLPAPPTIDVATTARQSATATPLPYEATPAVHELLAGIGRTEDLRFAPGNGLLAIAGFERERCLVVRVRIEQGAEARRVLLDDAIEIASDGIHHVHGIEFLDDETLVVANRDDCVAIVPLPDGPFAGRRAYVPALRQLRGRRFCRVRTPGSLVANAGPGGLVNVLVCNNDANYVTRHLLDPRAAYRVVREEIFLRRSLKVPDGIAVSRDGRWIAVSGHMTHDVKVFAIDGDAGPRTVPAGVLRGGSYPHGLRFTADGRHLLVADAGKPVVHVYEAAVAGWAVRATPARSVAVVDDAVFERGHGNPAEGGPKGIDIDRSGQVVAVTCEEQTLAFFALDEFLGRSHEEPRL